MKIRPMRAELFHADRRTEGRLTANIIAGHLLLTLLGNNGPLIRHTLLTVLITAQILLLILEAAVAVIQSYVFAILRTLYSTEVKIRGS